jgi:hypothetical protein
MLPSAAVEVIATIACDGSIRTRSFSIPEPSREVSSLVDGRAEPAEMPVANKGRPALIRVGSTSDSEEGSTSSSGDESSSHNKSERVVLTSAKELSTDSMALPTIHTVATASEDCTYDCLSDQITNMFCPAEHLCIGMQPQPTLPHNKSWVETNPQLVAAGCTHGADVFGTLQFWLTPGQEKGPKRSERQKPNNRSSGSRKRRSDHVKTIWNSWHVEQSIPLEHSKSLPSELRPHSLAASKGGAYVNDVCYDSDPEQEFPQRATRGEALRTPPIKTNSFRNCRPSSIETIQQDESCYLGTTQVPQAPRSTASSKAFNFHPRRKESSPTTTGRRRQGDTPPMGPSEHDLMRPDADYHLRCFIQVRYDSLVWRHSDLITVLRVTH